MAKQHIKSRPGLFGAVYYYDEHGNPIGKSRPGLLEGTRVYTNQNGRYAGKRRPGFLAKEVFTDADHNHITSYDSLFGEVHFQNGVPIGHTRPGSLGAAYTTLEAEDNASDEEYCEDSFEEEWMEDQEYSGDSVYEIDTESYEGDTPTVSQYTVVKNLQLFVLCLVICTVIACVYAVIRFN